MRFALALAVMSLLLVAAARADGPMLKCVIGKQAGYIVSQAYAKRHAKDFVASLSDPDPHVDEFWVPSEAACITADRIFLELLQDAAKDPTILYPDLSAKADPATSNSPDYQKLELSHILDNFTHYHRQYVGVTIDGHRFILCNYVVGPDLDPSEGFLFIQKYFAADGSTHFLQCRFDYDEKTCTHVSIVGPWQ